MLLLNSNYWLISASPPLCGPMNCRSPHYVVWRYAALVLMYSPAIPMQDPDLVFPWLWGAGSYQRQALHISSASGILWVASSLFVWGEVMCRDAVSVSSHWHQVICQLFLHVCTHVCTNSAYLGIVCCWSVVHGVSQHWKEPKQHDGGMCLQSRSI